MSARHCPVCGNAYDRKSRPKTVDHIIPQCRGGSRYAYGTSINTRPVCAPCNELRGAANHCIGLTACVIDISRRTKIPAQRLLATWRRTGNLGVFQYGRWVLNNMPFR